MPMMSTRFVFERTVTESEVRAAIEVEVGAGRASDRNLDVQVRASSSSAGVGASIQTMDYVAMVYAEKVCEALGGTRVHPRKQPLPAWASTPWVDLSPWRRFRRRSTAGTLRNSGTRC